VYTVRPVAEPGGQGGHRAPLAPLPEGMAPLVRLVRRPPPPAGGAGEKIGGRSKKKVVKKIYVDVFAAPVKYATVAPQENFVPPWVETLAPPLRQTRVVVGGGVEPSQLLDQPSQRMTLKIAPPPDHFDNYNPASDNYVFHINQ
jgi:hypothetical protein